MNHLHARYHWWSHVATFLSIATLAVAAQDPMPMVVALPVLIWSAWRFRTRLDAAAPPTVINALLLGALGLFILDLSSHGIDQVITAVGRFVVALTLVKLIERRTARDQGQLLTLGLMLAIGAALTSVTFETGVMFILYTPIAVWTLVLFQLWSGGVADAAARDPRYQRSGVSIVRPKRVALPRGLLRSARRVCFATMVAILAVTVAVFVSMPRQVGEGILGRWDEPKRFESGFKDHVQLGAAGTISTESTSVVLEAEVIVNATNGLHASGEQHYLLRGAVLDEYDPAHGTWTRSALHRGYVHGVSRTSELVSPGRRRGRTEPQPPPSEEKAHVGARTLPMMELRVSLRNHQSDQLFTLWRPVEFTLPSRVEASMSSVDGAAFLNEPAGTMDYSVVCDPRFVTPTFWQYLPATWTDSQMDFFFSSSIRDLTLEVLAARGLEAPDLDVLREEVRVAREVRDENLQPEVRRAGVRQRPKPAWPAPPSNARQIADAVQAHLQTTCVYTLDMTPPTGDEDPIEMFLFRTKEGHCEYFASAMAAMCRSVGLEARLVTGYAATEYDVAKQRYIVRESHAHAWAEVQVEPGVWATYDPSPQEQLAAIRQPETGMMALVRRTIDKLEGLWATRIVGFNQSVQAEMLEPAQMSDGPLGILKWIRGRLAIAQERPQPSSAGEYIRRVLMNFAVTITLLMSFALLVRAMFVTVRNRWGRGGSRSRRRHIAEAPAFYRKMMRMLGRAGFTKPEHEPAGRHAQRVAAAAPGAGAAVTALTELYQEVRYGGRVLSAQDRAWAQDELAQLGAALARAPHDRSEKRPNQG
ncbi:MAG: DUF3488 domain-containing protein [Phycisphaerales bacterium]|nr:DUF3488 domain-containing protein [Phycisphaerales bacterium]